MFGPGEIRELNVSTNTSSISLNWTSPPGEVFNYRVQWHNGGALMTVYTNSTFAVLSGLIPGSRYTILVIAVAGDNETDGNPHTFTSVTKPGVVSNINFTNITTSSISLEWIKPEGNSSFYRVQWTAGNVTDSNNVTQTNITITKLTPGVQYNITVTATTDDGRTDGQSNSVAQYTRPGEIRELNVSTNTSSISLNWTSPPGEVFNYRVQWQNGGALMTVYTNSTFAVLSGLIPGSRYTISVIAVAGDNETDGNPHTFTSVTKPSVVRNLSISDVTTSSMFLDWTEPDGNATSYTVQWTLRNDTFTHTTNETSFTINDLDPGVNYTITVTAVAVNSSNKGEGILKSSFTRPEQPEDIIVTARGTDYLNISWNLPGGSVDHYVVKISDDGHRDLYNITAVVTTALFTDLNPGRLYIITVIAVAGSFTNVSTQSLFATEPRPPGSIIISQRTNSLHLKWTTPALMEGAPNVSYIITYQSEGGEEQNINTSANTIELSSLLSGTSHNINVKTVGPQNLRSAAVQDSAFTLPNPVQKLTASPKSSTSIQVEWSDPLEAKLYYKYLVQTYSAGALFNTTIVSNNSTVVTNMEPGTRYTINVTTIAAEGSESSVEKTFSYTMPKPVANLRVDDVNTTSIRLTWDRQTDHKPSYSYLVIALQDAVVVQNKSTEMENYTFFHLTPGNLYTFDVFAVVEGVKSTGKSNESYTKPEAVSGLVAIGSTTTMTVKWTSAVGQVVSLTVRLSRDNNLVGNSTDLINTTVSKQFGDLTPGVLYCVAVFTKSGPFESTKSRVCNATFPNPPGSIMVESQTVKSINFTWAHPENMDHNRYNFSVSSFSGSSVTSNNWFLLDNLQSGSPYNLSVVTVGVRSYESTAVTTENYTRPYSVTMLRQTEITTNAVTLEWEPVENKSHYSYIVETTKGSIPQYKAVSNQHKETITGLLSGTNYSFTVTTQTADGTQAAPVTESYFTRPYSIRWLKCETLNTTAVRLNWTKPLEYKPEYTYRVQTTGCGSQNQTLAAQGTDISGLTPGTNCTFCVFVRAADGIEGEAICTVQSTKPEAVEANISSRGSNSSILVSWTRPPGKVEHYKVYLNSTSMASKEVSLNSSSTGFVFGNLSAGRLYTAVVTTFSGPFNASSGFVTNATYPNPPGPIDVLAKTIRSIDIQWKEAPLMAGAAFHYQLTISSPQGEENITSTNSTNTTNFFTSLRSGTSYSISVATVGVMGFKSEKVQTSMVTTRPFGVKLLSTSTEEKSIAVVWEKPDEYKESYRYNLTWQSTDGPIIAALINETNYDIVNLDPGKSYNISVTTETLDETKGAPSTISNCTNASPAKNLDCIGPNTTNAQVVLTCNKPNGQYSDFKVSVMDGEINKTHTCNHTVSNLRHNTEYNLTVETLSCGLPSRPQALLCRTGITNPPIPGNYESLVLASNREYNKFTLQMETSLLNHVNGPITHIGVLVTDDLPGDNSMKYVGKTHKQWREKDTPVYMATVIENHFQSRSGAGHLNIEIGNESKWEGYTNGPLEANGKYQYAIVLFTSLDLQNELVNGQQSLISITNFYPAVLLPQNPAVIAIATGATLGIFCVLVIILIGFIIYWKRFSHKESPDIQIHSMRAKVSVAVRVEDYEAYYKKQKADSNCGFAEEFEDLKVVGTAQMKTNAQTLENKPKNRYNNVLPYDSSRVKLSIIHGSPYDDYINANYMPGYNSRKEYIAAQGPLPTTVSEFWRMIWEKNVQTVVMLTRCNEQGRVKCEKYWDCGSRYFENITVTTTSEIQLEDWTIRDFGIKNVKTAETRSVRHFHFTAWPDHGVPQTTELLISFRHLVREHMDQYSRHSPAVVHCSAGVGRTGTFIAIDRLIFQIERENIVDLYGIVHDLRMHRPLMVQTEDQYVFLNQCAMDIIRSRTGTNVDLIYQNCAAIYENIDTKRGHYNA
ncbi:receptor-type tyrosine-protein phosphatase eta-like [Clinocottus analis]|uniref:receptor-type tyrosine-protein phosphatase eta-like n=1 Tax=Clinocottus analis TaxID=304258 RepID=UPI0035BF3D7E